MNIEHGACENAGDDDIKLGSIRKTNATYLLILVAVVIIFWPQKMGYGNDDQKPSGVVSGEQNIPGNNS